MMITAIITKYLGSNRRLVIPQLGTLIVKEPGQAVVFSEMLKRDDGVLRGLLMTEGLGEVAAAGEIDRLVFEIRHAVQQGEEFRLDGLGTMRPGANATIAFAYDPRRAEEAISEPVGEPVSEPAADPASNPVSGPASSSVADPASSSVADPVPLPGVSDPGSEPSKSQTSFSPKVQPEDCLKGLRYGKPRKVGDGYAYVRSGRRKVDRFLVVAVIAAIVAVAVIIFGYVRSTRDKQAEAEAVELLTMPAEQSPAQTTPAQ